MANEFENGPNRDARDEEELAAVSEEVTIGNPYHLSKGTRTFLRFVAVVLVFTMTALFLKGVIHT